MATQDMIDYHAEILPSILNKPVDDEDEDSDPLADVEFFKLHGNMSQKERTEVFKTFRLAKSGVLLCTVSLCHTNTINNCIFISWLFLVESYTVITQNVPLNLHDHTKVTLPCHSDIDRGGRD